MSGDQSFLSESGCRGFRWTYSWQGTLASYAVKAICSVKSGKLKVAGLVRVQSGVQQRLNSHESSYTHS